MLLAQHHEAQHSWPGCSVAAVLCYAIYFMAWGMEPGEFQPCRRMVLHCKGKRGSVEIIGKGRNTVDTT
jgi:hypothetical protein